jgi:Amt family ammonium transporter
MVIGPRIGRFDAEGRPCAVPGHNVPMAIVGVIILVFGWFGFNSCSTLSGWDLRFSVVAVNTLLAACAGCLAAMFYMWKKVGKPDPSMTANGMLAGLVAITAPCAFVPAWSALLIGAIAGMLVCAGVFLLERFRIDDPVGAVAVHGFNGLWGVLALGLFADGTYGAGLNGVEGTVKGLFFGDPGQFAAQALGAVTCAAFVFGLSYLFFRMLDRLQGIRVTPQEEVDGLDVHEMGVSAYVEDEAFKLPLLVPVQVVHPDDHARLRLQTAGQLFSQGDRPVPTTCAAQSKYHTTLLLHQEPRSKETDQLDDPLQVLLGVHPAKHIVPHFWLQP